eukprot:COSAG04_NODE_29193_length_269_cov_1.169591_1_plen_79_part_10
MDDEQRYLLDLQGVRPLLHTPTSLCLPRDPGQPPHPRLLANHPGLTLCRTCWRARAARTHEGGRLPTRAPQPSLLVCPV